MYEFNHGADAILVRAKQHDTRMGAGWIEANIGKSFICGNQEAALGLYLAPKLGVFPSCHALFDHGVGLIAFLTEQCDNLLGQIFIDFNLHGSFSRWGNLCGKRVDDLLAHHFHSISQGSIDIFIYQLGIRFADIVESHAIRQAADDRCYRDAGSLDAGIAVMDLRVNCNSILPSPIHVCLQSSYQDIIVHHYQFQWWALSLVHARPVGGDLGEKKGKKGADQGMDGVINFLEDPSGSPNRAIVQVKSGHVKSGDIRDLHGVLDREKAAIGVFITLEHPSPEMLKEASSTGFYTSKLWQKSYPRIQILTIEELLEGKEVKMPPDYGTFKQAQKRKEEGRQGELGI